MSAVAVRRSSSGSGKVGTASLHSPPEMDECAEHPPRLCQLSAHWFRSGYPVRQRTLVGGP